MRIRLRGFWPKPSPLPLPLGAEGQQRLKDQFYLKRGGFFSPSSSLPFYTFLPPHLPLPPLLSLISLCGTQSVSVSQSEFISLLRRPQPRWIRPLKSFHQHLGEAGGVLRETKSTTQHRKHTQGGPTQSRLDVNTETCVHKPVTRQRVRADARQGVSSTNPWPKFWNWRPIKNMCASALVRLPFLLKRHIWWINSGKQRPTVVSLFPRHSRVLVDVIDSCQARACTLVSQ